MPTGRQQAGFDLRTVLKERHVQLRFLLVCVAVSMLLGCKSSAESTATTATSGPASTQPAAATQPFVVGPLQVTVASVDVSSEYDVYVGGGSNISAPEPIGGDGGMPMISMSNGSSFLAGKIHATDDQTKLIRIECAVENPTEVPASFKIGDMALTVAGVRTDEFVAVGYDAQLCAMGDADRETVKAIAVEVSPKSHRTVSYVFALANPDAKSGQVALRNSVAPVSFEITSPKEK